MGKLPEVGAKNFNKVPNKGWNMAGRSMLGRKLMISKQIFKAFSENSVYLIYPDNPTFHERNDVQGTKVYQSLKENSKISHH